MTLTYRSDSDLHVPYFITKKRDTPCEECVQKKDIFPRKSKLMTWIVSHCHTSSKREKYMAELRKHIPVDVFGKCGIHFNCTREMFTNSCPKDLTLDYKFYFAAENTVSKEYFTGRYNWLIL